MHTAAIIIPTPHVISKYFNASIVVLLCATALLPCFHRHRLPCHLPYSLSEKEQPEHLPENQFFRQQRHRHRKNQARHHRHKCDRHLHNASRVPRAAPTYIAGPTPIFMVLKMQDLQKAAKLRRMAILGQCVGPNTLIQPQSGERMQPTACPEPAEGAQAWVWWRKLRKPRRGEGKAIGSKAPGPCRLG